MPNTSIPAAAEGLPKISRRSLLGGLAVMATPVAAAAAAAAAAQETSKFDLRHWLETADPLALAHYHAGELTKAMDKVSQYKAFRYKIDDENGFVLIFGDKKKETRA